MPNIASRGAEVNTSAAFFLLFRIGGSGSGAADAPLRRDAGASIQKADNDM